MALTPDDGISVTSLDPATLPLNPEDILLVFQDGELKRVDQASALGIPVPAVNAGGPQANQGELVIRPGENAPATQGVGVLIEGGTNAIQGGPVGIFGGYTDTDSTGGPLRLGGGNSNGGDKGRLFLEAPLTLNLMNNDEGNPSFEGTGGNDVYENNTDGPPSGALYRAGWVRLQIEGLGTYFLPVYTYD